MRVLYTSEQAGSGVVVSNSAVLDRSYTVGNGYCDRCLLSETGEVLEGKFYYISTEYVA